MGEWKRVIHSLLQHESLAGWWWCLGHCCSTGKSCFMQIAPLGWWWWGITATVNMIMLIKSSNVTIYRFFLFILSFGYVSASAWLFERYKDTKTFSPLKADNIFYYLFFFKFGGNLTSRWYLHSPPSGKEGWLKAGVVGGYTMLIINDLCIHLPPPPTGTPPSRRRRMEIPPTG